ncbi:MAG TPA: response regulator transcription factor [Thermoanaerobaculia bacterium]|jgi:DNA-binding NarL/FixJ family response regulator
MKPIRVLLADDHTLVRAGIRGLLAGLAGVEVVGEAGDGHEALRLAESLRPDVVLLDIGMPGLNGLEVAVRLAKLDPAIRIVILSMHMSEEYVLQALRAGAAGYLLKGADVAELEVAVRAVARGETYLSPAVSKRVVDDYVSRTNGAGDPLGALTSRQREILQLVAEGNTSKEIAHRLGLSYRTVEAHRNQMMKRLDVHDVTGLVRFAVRVGLIAGDG